VPHAYTPGLTVAEHTTIRRVRQLPLQGQVLKQVGDEVKAKDIVARTELPGDVAAVNVVNRLSISPAQIASFMLKHEGEPVAEGEPLAENKPFIKWFKTTVESPITGTVGSISSVTGQVMLRKPPRPVEVDAYVDGQVVEVMANEGVVVETTGTLVQGILGIGGESYGDIRAIVDSPQDVLDTSDVPADGLSGKIVVCGSLVTMPALSALRERGVAAAIVGGFEAQDLQDLLGYDLGVAITGNEDVGLTLVITEGFGRIAMAERTFELLKSREGQFASVNGATQIRAGVMRPEIVAPAPDAGRAGTAVEATESGIEIGSTVRVIRVPYFGRLGQVAALPEQPAQIETGATVRIATVEFADGARADVPRANLEAVRD